MADRRVRYILEVDYEGESVVVRAADDLRQVDDAAREASAGLAETGGGFSALQAGIVTAQSALGLVQQGLGYVKQAAEMAWETLSEGSALADARGDFADLAAEIGTTADVMENRLVDATAGLKTSAEAIGEASELMALNLGLSEDEIVSLSGVAAELDWNMQAVADTINTGATRGLKELGLNVGATRARFEELKEEGYSVNEAMALAMVEAGAEKIERVGKRSEEAAGQMEILTNVVQNVQDEFARGAAEGFAMALATIAGTAPEAGDALADAAHSGGTFIASFAGTAVLSMFGSSLAYMVEQGRELEKQQLAEAYAARLAATGWEEYYASLRPDEVEEAAAAAEQHAFSLEEEAAEMEAAAERSEWLARAAGWVADEQHRAAAADYQRAQAVGEMNQALVDQETRMEMAGRAAQAWSDYVGEATARGGDYFEQVTQTGRAQFDLNDAMYAGAAAAGAGAGDLAGIGVETGQFSQSVADAGVAAAQAEVVIDNLAGAAREGRIAWQDYTTAVQQALDILNGAPPVEPPEVKVDKDFKGYLPDFVEEGGEMSYYAEVEIGANYDEVMAAVEEAKGVVEGFTSPGEVYEAVMDMDISGVEEKGEIVRGIIEGLPLRKVVIIDLQVTNQELLEQIRAAGGF